MRAAPSTRLAERHPQDSKNMIRAPRGKAARLALTDLGNMIKGTGTLKLTNRHEDRQIVEARSAIHEVFTVAKPELGTKRICPETGRKFYDLNRDPIVSPYTGKSYPLSYFEDTATASAAEKEEEEDVAELDTESSDVEVVSLEEADKEESDKDDDLPDMDGDDEVEIDDEDDDTFLPDDDDDDDDDMSDIIGGVNEEDDES
jgi:uncharacterized protein (TIGR02300 family)